MPEARVRAVADSSTAAPCPRNGQVDDVGSSWRSGGRRGCPATRAVRRRTARLAAVALMRVVVSSLGERTHLLPMVPVAWALRAAGHDVVVAVPPQLVPVAAGTGLPVIAVGRDHRVYRTLDRLQQLAATASGSAALTSTGLISESLAARSWDSWFDFFRHNVGLWWRLMNDPLMDDLVALCRSRGADLVLWEGFSWAGAVAAAACDVPHARVMSGSDLLRPARARFLQQGVAQEGRTADPLGDWLGGRLAAHGRRFDESVVHGRATVDFLPASLQPFPAPGGAAQDSGGSLLPVRFVAHNGRAVVPAWLRAPPRRPRVAITLGQSTFEQTRTGAYRSSGLRDLLVGVADAGAEVVATLPARLHDALRPLPDGVRLEEFVPLDTLAATCRAVVDHGGAATVCTVARHAIPQLVVPDVTYDERLLGRALTDPGRRRLHGGQRADQGVRELGDRCAARGRVLPACGPRAARRDRGHAAPGRSRAPPGGAGRVEPARRDADLDALTSPVRR